MKKGRFNQGPPPYVFGTLDVAQFAKLLTKAGVEDVRVEEGPTGGHIIDIVSQLL